MEELMDKAIAELEKLPREQKDRFAEFILNELRSEERWERLFASSGELLDKLADEAIEDARVGRTRPLRPDEL